MDYTKGQAAGKVTWDVRAETGERRRSLENSVKSKSKMAFAGRTWVMRNSGIDDWVRRHPQCRNVGRQVRLRARVKRKPYRSSWGVAKVDFCSGWVMGERVLAIDSAIIKPFMLHCPLKDGVREVEYVQCPVYAATRKWLNGGNVDGVGLPLGWVW